MSETSISNNVASRKLKDEKRCLLEKSLCANLPEKSMYSDGDIIITDRKALTDKNRVLTISPKYNMTFEVSNGSLSSVSFDCYSTLAWISLAANGDHLSAEVQLELRQLGQKDIVFRSFKNNCMKCTKLSYTEYIGEFGLSMIRVTLTAVTDPFIETY